MDTAFDDTQLRCLIDVRDAYEATMGLWRELDALAGHMKWRAAKGKDYLWHSKGYGSGESLGVRSSETERIYETHRRAKAETKERLGATEPDLKRAAAMYVAAGLPVIDTWSAKLFQHLDRERLMGTLVMVVGTNAMPVYQIEAQRKTGQRLHSTRDTDLAWATDSASEDPILWPALKEFDPMFRINFERPFQALNKAGREVELLAAPSRLTALAAEPFRPLPLKEQEWLLMGEPLRHVVCSLDRTASAVVVPDPRFFALQKAWLSKKPERDPLKKPKDINQAKLLWSWLTDMPRFPVDEVFRASVPDELQLTLRDLDAAIA